jgi:hypothetical protein
MNHRRGRSVGRRAALVAGAAVIVAAGAAIGFQLAPSPTSHAPGAQGTTTPSPGGNQTTSPGSAGHKSTRPGTSGSPRAGHTSPPGTLAQQLVPSSGAYLGAYVEPSSYTDSGEIDAVRSFEQTLRRSISLVHVYHPWSDPFPSLADRHFVDSGKVLLMTWGGGADTRRIIAGDYDALIRARAEAIKALHRPILMEFRHEMDRGNLQRTVHGPAYYIAAWHHIRAIFTQVGATNVGWVWCPTGYGFMIGRAQPFYPGNNEVDWVCADVYSSSPGQSLQQAAAPFLQWAVHTGKPVIIGEFAVNGRPSSWANWLLAAGRLAETDHQIKAMAYFDANGTDSNGRPFHYWLGESQRAISSFAQMLAWQFFRPAMPPSL